MNECWPMFESLDNRSLEQVDLMRTRPLISCVANFVFLVVEISHLIFPKLAANWPSFGDESKWALLVLCPQLGPATRPLRRPDKLGIRLHIGPLEWQTYGGVLRSGWWAERRLMRRRDAATAPGKISFSGPS